MKNRFFQEMQRMGIKYRKGKLTQEDIKRSQFAICPPFSEGQSYAYKFWAISDRYSSTDIIVDDLPNADEIQVMLKTFLSAKIDSVVVTKNEILMILISYGCEILSEEKVYRRETELYYGQLEIVRGIRIRING